jgi:glycosyltransferase involved in cell wall biosynthesis
MDISIAGIIPCYNEELTVAKVIGDFKKAVPEAKIYVFDNNSTDRTAEIAQSSGAIVIKEKRQGKGYVVQSMFNKIDADIYIMVDGDDTYDLAEVNRMISMVTHDEADMVVGTRLETYTDKSFRPFHTFGNKLVKNLINRLFRTRLKDIMSGLRVMSKAFVKNINIMASGFEVETEMTIKALKYGFLIKEMEINYKERPAGSFSKLNTFRDGARVIKTIFIIFKDYRPLLFFSMISLFFLLISLLSGYVVVQEFIKTRFITHVPLAIFASGTMILAIISFITGVILDSVNRRFDELYSYLKTNRYEGSQN